MVRIVFALSVLMLLSFAAPTPSEVASAPAAQSSLPSVTSGERPGPDVLYAPPPAAPQLENRNPRFNAPPLLVSGTEAYADGEYIYQDFLYDDYGSDANGAGSGPLQVRVGDTTYPTNRARYADNAADIVEFRIDVAPASVAYRITLNSLLEPDSTIVVVAFDTDRNEATGTATLPRDPGAPFPGTDEVITTWGTGAIHTRVSPLVTTFVPVTTDLEANQITVTVPRTASDPRGTWRTTVATGLYNPATGGWLRPGMQATATSPGGAGPLDTSPSGIFNLAFRFDEPMVSSDTPPDAAQAVALRNHEPTAYAHDIDFAALDRGDERTTVPESGTQVRIFPSRLQLGEGRNLSKFPAYLGQLQPYSLYVPTSYEPGTPAGLTLNLHSLSEHYWQYNGSNMVQQIGEQRGNFVATSLSRGDDGWYQDVAEYDVFEMWNDIARHFTLDPDRAAISGYSMGGFATYRFGGLYPDLFGKAFTQVGPPAEGIWVPPLPPTGSGRGDEGTDADGAEETLSNLWLENTRNVPFLNLAGGVDELVPVAGTRAQNLGAPEFGIDGFDQLGYRFRYLLYPTSDHFALAVLDDYPMAAEFLGDAYVDRNPAHVTFAYLPDSDYEPLGLVHDHAYWLSELKLASEETFPAKGVVDAFSHAFGVGDPASVSSVAPGVGPLPYTEFRRDWLPAPAIPAANRLDVTLTNISSATIDTARAGIERCQPLSLVVDSDGPAKLMLSGYAPVLSVSGASYEQWAQGPNIVVGAGHSVISITPDCRSADLQVLYLSAANGLGNRVTITAIVGNTGNLAALASQAGLALDGSPIGTAPTPALAPGSAAIVTFSWDARGVQTGWHTLSASADIARAVAESSESNNTRTTQVNLKNGRLQ